jgi:hypothetical protein
VNIPLQIQPQVFGFFSLVAWGQILHYTQYVLALLDVPKERLGVNMLMLMLLSLVEISPASRP